MKNKDKIDSLTELGGHLHKEPLGLSPLEKTQLFQCSKNVPGKNFFEEGFSWTHPSEHLAKSAFSAWSNFDALP